MDASIVGLFAIIFLVLALNLFFVFRRFRSTKRKRPARIPVDEAKQALWREKEVARRIEREQYDAIERIKLRNETLALYEEVRRRHANDDVDILPELSVEKPQEVAGAKNMDIYGDKKTEWGSLFIDLDLEIDGND